VEVGEVLLAMGLGVAAVLVQLSVPIGVHPEHLVGVVVVTRTLRTLATEDQVLTVTLD